MHMSKSNSSPQGSIPPFFEIRITSVAPSMPLPCDLYLLVGDKKVLFRKRGDSLSSDRMKGLTEHGAGRFFVPEDQRGSFFTNLREIIRDTGNDLGLRGKLLKESAFFHVHDLFTKEEVSEAIVDARELVEDMVAFVTEDVAAASSLMGLSAHDYYTYNHSVDVAVYSIVIAKKVYGENKELLFMAGMSGLLHDIGKRNIPWELINKKSALTSEEWEEIKRHPTYGRDIVRLLPTLPEEAKAAVYQHHENYDGSGYPNGFVGEDIHRLARIVSIADVFDALTTNRSYHKAVTPSEALTTMYGMQPGKFDPTMFQSFDKNFEKKNGLLLPKDYDPCTPQKVLPFKKR